MDHARLRNAADILFISVDTLEQCRQAMNMVQFNMNMVARDLEGANLTSGLPMMQLGRPLVFYGSGALSGQHRNVDAPDLDAFINAVPEYKPVIVLCTQIQQPLAALIVPEGEFSAAQRKLIDPNYDELHGHLIRMNVICTGHTNLMGLVNLLAGLRQNAEQLGAMPGPIIAMPM